jgi:MFS family permease
MTETYDSDTAITDHQGTSAPRNTRFCFIHNLPPVITLLRSTRLLAALWGSLVQAAIFCAFDSVLPLFVHRTFGWNPTGAGLIFLPIVIPSLTAPLVGQMADKYGPRWLAAIGFIIALPFIVLLRLVTHHSLRQVVLLCVLLTLIGSSMNLAMIPLMAEITYVVEAKEKKTPGMFGKGGAYAQAYGLYFSSFAGGAAIGPIWAGFMVQRVGWGTMTWSLGLLSGLTAAPILICTGGL